MNTIITTKMYSGLESRKTKGILLKKEANNLKNDIICSHQEIKNNLGKTVLSSIGSQQIKAHESF